jgi:type IV pilus assembly protein PilE
MTPAAHGSSATLIFRQRRTGFSLIELLVVLVIMGLLSAIALPNYRQHIQRGYRVEGAAALQEAQHFMERYYSVNGRYTSAVGETPDLPSRLQTVPSDALARYQVSVSTATANAYSLQAEPVGTMVEDPCGSLTLSHTGQKAITGSGMTSAECWR